MCENVAIVGGGLAGLSTAYHLLDKLQGNIRITVIDKAEPGEGGASSVAGG
jgi:Glycine/D-amino acid oxidases (deaminating)